MLDGSLSGGGIVNEEYERVDVRKQLRSLFLQDDAMPSVQLQKFLSQKEFSSFVNELSKTKLKKIDVVAERSLSVGELPKSCKSILAGRKVQSLIENVVGRKLKLNTVRIEVYSWKDYTLQEVEPSCVETIFSVNALDSSCGGGVFAVDGSGEFKQLTAPQNTLTILDRKKNVRLFHKYVNHCAENNSLWFVVARWK